ncbi:MAG: isoleucine--tRNA ligase [Bacteroidales bacterium]
MSRKFEEYKSLDLQTIDKEIIKFWNKTKAFEESLRSREGAPAFIFYEGPPSANGMPGIHHVLARAIKDLFGRYKTMKGFHVDRKAGWDTHGLPVELAVEKSLNITKDDIGNKVSVEEYNAACRKEVMKYTGEWEELTRKMGYWVDMDKPYITYDSKYIETLWWLLKEMYKKDLLYKGYTIQPYSPAAGTGLSSHELNQPGCYRDVKDTTAVAQFKVIKDEKSQKLFNDAHGEVYLIAWTTTPWTLPSNTALAVGDNIEYVKIKSYNKYSYKPITVILAKELVSKHFDGKMADLSLSDYEEGDKNIPFEICESYKGSELCGISYEQLLNWVKPNGSAFRVISGDFVTTSDGTGIVHIAPTFGADDNRVAKQNNIAPLIIIDKDERIQPLVNKKGFFYSIDEMATDFVKSNVNATAYSDFAGRAVKNDYDTSLRQDDLPLDVDITVYLKQNDLLFKSEKYVHSYPHCWRTDKPVLYYPLDSWFIKTPAIQDRLIELNDTINWKPESTGTGRFGNWLSNLVDWNLSRSRYWGTPLPIWRSEDGKEEICIGSYEELINEINKSVAKGYMKSNPYADFNAGDNSKENYLNIDPHRPKVDDIILVSKSGDKMYRESDLVDVWFDSGAMPYAQQHYPFENKYVFADNFPADFISEGVDQTRGWFFTLHVIATAINDSVAFKNIISTGLIQDKNGNKMSKRLNNAIDPFLTIDKYGADPLRWYMMSNSQPWDNLKFNIDGVEEVRRKFFGTLYNTYNFFALYANIDKFSGDEAEVLSDEQTELDKWILSLLNSLIDKVDESLDNYEPTRAARAIEEFVSENLSNWYVRLNRKRFWGGELDNNKLTAYQTLYKCLLTLSKLIAPIAPFYAERLYQDLVDTNKPETCNSVHLCTFPKADKTLINSELEEKMAMAQQASSMILALRRKEKIKVRQPLSGIIVPVLNSRFREVFESIQDIVLSEVNIKSVRFITPEDQLIKKGIKPNFKTLGPKYGKLMKQIAGELKKFSQDQINDIEREEAYTLEINGEKVILSIEDVEIKTEDIPGWLVATEGKLTIALNIDITEELKEEGIAREFVNKIQNIRKDSGLEVTDRIDISISENTFYNEAVKNHREYINTQTLANSLQLVAKAELSQTKEIEIDNDVFAKIEIKKS